MLNWDAAAFLAWGAANLVLAIASWTVAGMLFPGEGVRRRCLASLVLGLSLLTVVASVLGAVGLLRPDLLLALTAVGAAASWYCCGRRPAATAREASRASGTSKVFWSCLLAFALGHAVIKTASEFTTEFDCLMYHIPLIDYWIQSRSLFAPASSHWSNPGGNELIGLWFVGPFSGDFLVRLANVPTTLMLVLAASELGSILGLRRPLDLAAGAAVASNSVVISQLVDPGNDVAVAAFFIAGLCYSLRYRVTNRGADLALCAACLGLLAGIKYYALGYAAILWASLVIPAWVNGGLGRGLRTAALGLLGAFALGGYWYARNALVSGTPFFPMGLLPGSGVLAQTYPDAWRSSFAGNGRPEVPALAVEALWRVTGICHLAAILGLPIILPWLVLGGRADRRALALWLAASAVVLAITPFALEDRPGSLNHLRWAYTPVRYGLCFLSLSVIALALALQALARRRRGPASSRKFARAWPTALVGGAAALQFLFHGMSLSLDWLILGPLVLSAALLAGLRGDRPVPPRLAVPAFATALVAGAALVGWFSRSWGGQFPRAYDRFYGTSVFRKLESLDRGDIRICLLDYRCHPFFGARRQFWVCQPTRVPSAEWLADHLRRQGVDLVVMRSFEGGEPAGWDAFTRPEEWRQALDDGATLIHEDAAFSVYSMKESQDTAVSGPATTRR